MSAIRLSLLACAFASSLTRMANAILTVAQVAGNSEVLKCSNILGRLRKATNLSSLLLGNENTAPELMLC